MSRMLWRLSWLHGLSDGHKGYLTDAVCAVAGMRVSLESWYTNGQSSKQDPRTSSVAYHDDLRQGNDVSREW